MKSKKILILNSFLFTLIGTSCNQIKLPNTFVLPNIITELANYHIDGNVYYYNEYKNSTYYEEDDPYYPVSLLAGDFYHDIFTKDGELSRNYSINYNQNLETTNGYSDYPQLVNTPFRNYSYVKIKLNEMAGFSLESLGGVVTLHGGDVRNNINDENSNFKINGILYASEDEKSKVLDYFGNRFGFNILLEHDEFGTPIYGNKLDTKYNNFYDFLDGELSQYFGYYFDASTNSIKFSESVKNRHVNLARGEVTSTEDNFVRDLSRAIYFNGCMTTLEIRDYIDNSEENIIEEWNNLIFEAYNDAIDYWRNLYEEKVAQINENKRKIRENEQKIEDAYDTIERNNAENERLNRENITLNRRLETATENYNNSSSDYNSYSSQANSFLNQYNSVSRQLERLENQVDSLREDNRDISNEIDILETMLNNSSLTEQQREQIRSQIESLNADYASNTENINELNSQIRDLEYEADDYYDYYQYFQDLADEAENDADNYYEEMNNLKEQISENNKTIRDNNNENSSLKNSIPRWEREIDEWQDEIDSDLIPKRDDYYEKWQERERKLRNYENTFKNNSFEYPNERLKNQFDSYYENLINQYREDNVNNVKEEYRRGVDEPDIWEWSSDTYNLNGWKMNGDQRTVNEELEKYCSDEVRKYDSNTFPSNGNGFYIVPFTMNSNNRYDLALTNYPIDVLSEGFTFGNEFDEMTLVIQFDFSNIDCKNEKSLMTALGAFTFVPTAETYEKDLALGKYEDWEIKNMESNKEENENS